MTVVLTWLAGKLRKLPGRVIFTLLFVVALCLGAFVGAMHLRDLKATIARQAASLAVERIAKDLAEQANKELELLIEDQTWRLEKLQDANRTITEGMGPLKKQIEELTRKPAPVPTNRPNTPTQTESAPDANRSLPDRLNALHGDLNRMLKQSSR
ncbi:hypothetical protein [Aureimonas sp. AU40]|uniref:hypothetical protein n=1 Tax=Aureimonas sp. AU40 TaxID=1637747 RepID=UPI0007803283|nr:hypothetical protein [Aureimonas sp. AU40]